MINLDILNRFGTTNKRLRELYTANATNIPKIERGDTAEEKAEKNKIALRIKQDIEFRQNTERRIRVRVDEGITRSLRNYKKYAAADLAWDTSCVTEATIPLIMYAQGKINIESAATALQGLRGGSDCIKKNAEGAAIAIDLPRFLECNINLVRSYISRRVAAQSNIFSKLYPYYNYESRSTGPVGKLRADVLSQRVEIMSDQFDYRHHDVQCIRDGFLYGHCLDFPASAWEVEKQWTFKDYSDEMKSSQPPEDNSDLEAEIVKEGISWINPHPSRVFWDNASPLSSINTDTGCKFLGYWDIQRYRDVMNNPAFFNLDTIGWSTRFWGPGGLYYNYKAYFDQYTTAIKPPAFPQGTNIDPASENDRSANIGTYNVQLDDASIFVTNYFEQLVPSENGIGEYPFPVWIRYIVASDATVVYAEIYPSTPAAYLGINENDSRQVNISMAHELMAYQDQLTNLFRQMLTIASGEVFKAIGINTDALERAQVDKIFLKLSGQDWSGDPLIYEFSLKKLQELQIKPDQVVTVTETRIGQSLTAIFESMAKLIAMADKLMAMSPAEQGQPAPREISATEVTEIASTTSSVYSFITQGINEFRSAKKRIIYESLVTCSEGEIRCPVLDRYTPTIIKKAGFEAIDGTAEGFVSAAGVDRHTVVGSVRKLVYDYVFTSRDGEERAVKTQAANTLVQLLGQALNVPAVLSAMGKEKVFEIFNEIFRLSGAGVDLNLELKPGEDNTIGPDEVKQFQQALQQLQQALQQLATHVQSDAQQIQQQQQINASNDAHFKALTAIAKQVERLTHSNAKESVSINYKDAPASIQRQIEAAAGFSPAPDAERPGVSAVNPTPTQ